jgi:L-ascorbate metabolism protein UlaG (beta-lactamase superfamily)
MTLDQPVASKTRAPLAVTWVGHATALLEIDGVRLLTDPILRDRVGPLTRIAAPASAAVGEEIDAVLISHLHLDHADIRSLRRVGSSTRILAPRGARDWLRRHRFPNVHELSPGEQTNVGAVQVTATPASHNGRRWPLVATKVKPLGFVARGSQSCYFAGDTDLFAAMADLAGLIDIALLPVWGWGPRLGPGHLDPKRATTAARLIAPRVAVPIHWGTFTLAAPRRPADPWLPARQFSALVARQAPLVEVRILAPGERTELLLAAH